MLFKPELIALVIAGEKTQTRRVVKLGDLAAFRKDGRLHSLPPSEVHSSFGMTAVMRSAYVPDPVSDHPRKVRVVLKKWEVGRSYALQPGRGKRAVGRIRITAIRYCERAGEISDEDARAEGFTTAEEFREVYGRLNGAGALDRPCWALTFAVV
jgi:hypothetical protein